jgi:hypothetical protein
MVTFFSLFHFSSIPSYACSCAELDSVKEAFEGSSAVFSGKVVEIVDANKNKSIQSSADSIKVLFEVEESWKGINQTQITVNTARSSDSCGYEFDLNKEYLVYANETNGTFNVSLCSRTTLLSLAEKDIQELGEGLKPTKQVSNISNITVDEDPISFENLTYKIYIFLLILGLIFTIVYIVRRIRR